MAFIYKITNDINEKVYIGKTESSVAKRWNQHRRDYKKLRYENRRPLYDAMSKYGLEHFHIETIEETSNPEEREMYWIEYYDTYKNGYNATKGGDGRAYIDVDMLLELWNEGKRLCEIQRETGHDGQIISLHLRHLGVTTEEIHERSRSEQRKAVAQIDIETGKVLNIFPSSKEAGKSVGDNGGHIRHVCNGQRKTAFGYKWAYIEE